jgi:parallel beta-helix repeat protein
LKAEAFEQLGACSSAIELLFTSFIFGIVLLELGGRKLFKRIVSKIVLVLLLTSMIILERKIQSVKGWTGTVYIRADGSIDPPDAPIVTYDNITYTLIDNITSSGDGIVVERSDIILNGNHHIIQSSGGSSHDGLQWNSINNVTIRNTIIIGFGYAVIVRNSLYSNITESDIISNAVGIYLYQSANVSVCGNNLRAHYILTSIWLWESSHNNISGNNVTDNSYGISIEWSQDNIISGNNITSNEFGIMLNNSPTNIVIGNNIVSNWRYGIYMRGSNSRFYHNNFINNDCQVAVLDGANIWDNGYPSGGNYWNDCKNVDLHAGPHQNETGSDGIGDVPYVVDASNVDHYPLMKQYPWASHDIGITSVATSKTGCLPLPTVGQGLPLFISITTLNYGISTETFNITVYANTTIIAAFTNIILGDRNSTTITFNWNTSGFAKGNCTIRACATAIPGETDTSDNVLRCWVILTIPGDVNGDTTVNFLDAIQLGTAFSSKPDDSNWNPNADMNNDNVVNYLDAIILGANFGKS